MASYSERLDPGQVKFGQVNKKEEGTVSGMSGLTGDPEVVGQGNVNDETNPLGNNFDLDITDLGTSGDLPDVNYQGTLSDVAGDSQNRKARGTYMDVMNDPREDQGTFGDSSTDPIRRRIFDDPDSPDEDVGGYGTRIIADPNVIEHGSPGDVTTPLGDSRSSSDKARGANRAQPGMPVRKFQNLSYNPREQRIVGRFGNSTSAIV